MHMKISITALAVIATTTVAAIAHSGATGVVKERMDAMGEMQNSLETLTKIMRGQQEYDAAAVKAHAATIKSHAGESLTEKFPEGSTDHPSEALPAVWTDWERFSELAQRLETLAGGLESAAENIPAAGGDRTEESMGSMMGTEGGGMMMDGESMMGGGMAGNEMPDPEMLAQMPADAVFNMMAQACSECHTDFRVEKE